MADYDLTHATTKLHVLLDYGQSYPRDLRELVYISEKLRTAHFKLVCLALIFTMGRKQDLHLKDPGVDGSKILKRIIQKSVATAWTGLIWLRTREATGSSGHNNETSGLFKTQGQSYLAEELLS
jgi:hypothetical protein